jgi:hypothetical protein
MVQMLRYPTKAHTLRWGRVAGKVAIVAILCACWSSLVLGQQPEVHYLHQGVMAPPGAIGSLQLARGGPLPGYFQPVEIKAPSGASVSLAAGGTFDSSATTPLPVGLLIGQVYRLRVTGIPLTPGVEVFPTIEIIDRLYAPEGQERRFPIPIELTAEDLQLAAEGKFVTRVIYLEDPLAAVPAGEIAGSQHSFDAGPSRDPLVVADELGRPVAILRLGARLPDKTQPLDEQFLFGCPPYQRYPGGVKRIASPPKTVSVPAAPRQARR